MDKEKEFIKHIQECINLCDGIEDFMRLSAALVAATISIWEQVGLDNDQEMKDRFIASVNTNLVMKKKGNKDGK